MENKITNLVKDIYLSSFEEDLRRELRGALLRVCDLTVDDMSQQSKWWIAFDTAQEQSRKISISREQAHQRRAEALALWNQANRDVLSTNHAERHRTLLATLYEKA